MAPLVQIMACLFRCQTITRTNVGLFLIAFPKTNFGAICIKMIQFSLNKMSEYYTDVIMRDSVSNHQPHDCLLNRLFRRRSKKTSRLRVTGLCVGNSPGTGEFPAQMASDAENVSIWWRHHEMSSDSWWLSHPHCINPDLQFVHVASRGRGGSCHHHQLRVRVRLQLLYDGVPPDPLLHIPIQFWHYAILGRFAYS